MCLLSRVNSFHHASSLSSKHSLIHVCPHHQQSTTIRVTITEVCSNRIVRDMSCYFADGREPFVLTSSSCSRWVATNMKIFEKYTSSGSIFSVDVDISGKIMMQIEGWMKNTVFILLPPVSYFLLILFFYFQCKKRWVQRYFNELFRK